MDSGQAQQQNSVDLNSLRLHLYAEFDDWQDFVEAVDEFQRKTLIKLTITTSKKASTSLDQASGSTTSSGGGGRGGSKRKKMILLSNGDVGYEQPVRFEYRYLKLTCKHYGSYRSSSKGIRPNQRTTKLMCPTYIYGSYDHYKDKFVIKQMNVNCNHELKDEEVLLPRLLKMIPGQEDSSSDSSSVSNKKRYVKVRNRNVIKVPLESSGNLLCNVNNSTTTPTITTKSKTMRCTHEPSETCQAMSLSSEDISSIQSNFSSQSSVQEENQLILKWIEVRRLSEENGNKNTLQLFCSLPTIDGTLLKVCYESFLHILKITARRINELVFLHYGRSEEDEDEGDVEGEEVEEEGGEELETSVANILRSISEDCTAGDGREEGSPQIIYCDTVDMPAEEDATLDDDDHFEKEETIQTATSEDSSSLNKVTPIPSSVQSANTLLNYPSIKVSPIFNGFSVDIDCDFEVSLHGVSLENDSRSVKLYFGAQ